MEASTAFRVKLREGSTVVELEAPSILEAAQEEFAQEDFFADIDPERTALDYLSESLSAAASEGSEEDDDLYDGSMLETFMRLQSVFDRGIGTMEVRDRQVEGVGVRLSAGTLERFEALGARIPHPQQVITAGRLDAIRHSDRGFVLHMPGGARIKGLAKPEHLDTMPELWGGDVLVSGRAHFTSGGKVQRIEAEEIRAATESDLDRWPLPEPVSKSKPTAGFRRPQGSRSGLASILGRWPGEEADEEIVEALKEMS